MGQALLERVQGDAGYTEYGGCQSNDSREKRSRANGKSHLAAVVHNKLTLASCLRLAAVMRVVRGAPRITVRDAVEVVEGSFAALIEIFLQCGTFG